MPRISTREATTITRFIAAGLSSEIRSSTYHEKALIKDTHTGEVIKIPMMSILNKYKDYLDEIKTEKVYFPDDEWRKYKYQPKRLSFDLYGTTEYWSLILDINHCISVVDFTEPWVYLYDPALLPKYVNEIFIRENLI